MKRGKERKAEEGKRDSKREREGKEEGSEEERERTENGVGRLRNFKCAFDASRANLGCMTQLPTLTLPRSTAGFHFKIQRTFVNFTAGHMSCAISESVGNEIAVFMRP